MTCSSTWLPLIQRRLTRLACVLKKYQLQTEADSRSGWSPTHGEVTSQHVMSGLFILYRTWHVKTTRWDSVTITSQGDRWMIRSSHIGSTHKHYTHDSVQMVWLQIRSTEGLGCSKWTILSGTRCGQGKVKQIWGKLWLEYWKNALASGHSLPPILHLSYIQFLFNYLEKKMKLDQNLLQNDHIFNRCLFMFG